MADGNAWTLAKPRVAYALDAGPKGYGVRVVVPGCDFQALLDRVDECHAFHDEVDKLPEAEQGDAWAARPELHFARAELEVGRALLLANYDLTDAEAASLLAFWYDPETNPEGFELRCAVMGVAYGRAPKPSDGGTASPPSPAASSPSEPSPPSTTSSTPSA